MCVLAGQLTDISQLHPEEFRTVNSVIFMVSTLLISTYRNYLTVIFVLQVS